MTTAPDLHYELAQIKAMLVNLIRTQSPVMSSAEVCEMLRISRNTLTAYKKRPDFPAPTHGKFDRAAVVQWALENKQNTRLQRH